MKVKKEGCEETSELQEQGTINVPVLNRQDELSTQRGLQ